MPTLAQNKRAFHDYEILDKYEAGIKLLGHEVKSLKQTGGNLTGGHVKVGGGKLWLVGLHIPLYKKAGEVENYDPDRSRQLLMHRAEIQSLESKVSRQGYTVIPLELYTKGNLIKVALGIAKGKKKGDKRQDLIKKQQEMEMARATKTRL